MIFFYNLGILFYTIFIKFAAFFNPKAKLWVSGRVGVFEKIAEKIATQITDNEPIIWFHAASLGEFEQGRPLIEKIKKEKPEYKILLTFFSPSGYEIRKNYPQADIIAYLPIDTAANATRFLDLVKPKIIIFIKYEFWYHYLNEATKRNIPTIYIAALFWRELSYFKPYFSFFIPVFQRVTHFFVQNSASAKCLEEFVFRHENAKISVVGDPRVDRVVAIAKEAKNYPIIELFCGNNKILIAGSTWQKDDVLLQQLIAKKQDWKFIIASHDIGESRLQFIENQYNREEIIRFSKATEENMEAAKILLIDNIGMLSSLYRYGTLAYIGGGFGAGIHNTLEPMAFGLPVIFGSKFRQFEEAVAMTNQGGAFSVKNFDELESVFLNLEKTAFLAKAKNAVESYMLDNQGATEKIFEFIQKPPF